MGRRLLIAALSIGVCALGPPVGAASAQSSPDEVSAHIAALFGAYGQEYQQLQAQAGAIHATFLNMLQGVGATPGHPLSGICDAGVSVVGGAHMALGPLHSCGPMPTNPQPFLGATQGYVAELSDIVSSQTTTMQSLLNATNLTEQQWQSIDPSSIPPPVYASFVERVTGVNALLSNALPLTTQMNRVNGSLEARFGLYATWFGNGSSLRLRATRTAHTASLAPRTRAQAWAGLVELNAELRAILHGPGALPTHLELPARPHLPVSVVVCEAEHCSIDVQAVLTVGGEDTQLPGQRLRLDSGETAIVHVELTQEQLDALRAHGGGRLAVTIESDGHARTLHAQLTT